MKKSLKVGVIGIGNMGKNHVRTYADISEVELVAVADLNEEAVNEIAKKYNIHPYTSFQEMIRQEAIDAVSICVPTTYHYQVAKACIEQKVHVLIEKPITADLNEAKELLKLAKKHRVKLHVGHIERFNPAIIKLKEMVKNGELGEITSVIARRVGGFPPQITDVNIAIDLAIHDVDIINYLLDELPKNVYYHKKRNHIEKREDSVELFLKYNSVSAYIQTNWITPVKIRKLNITGTKGYLEMDYITQNIVFYRSNYSKLKTEIADFADYILRFSEPNKEDILVKKKQPLKEELLDFIYCIKNNVNKSAQYAVDALTIVLKV